MPDPIPKSAEEIVAEFRSRYPHVYPATDFVPGRHFTDLPVFITDWLRSALESYSAHLAGRMPTKINHDKPGSSGYRSEGYNLAIDNVQAVLAGEIEKLSE